jgi:Flp pilus assembly protein TadG
MVRNALAFFRRAPRSGEDGQALIELALSLPLLCLMLIGSAEMARVIYAAIEVSDAAHAAAQFASSSHARAVNYTGSGSNYTGGILNAATANSDLFGSSAISVSKVTRTCTCANAAFVPADCNDNVTCHTNNTAMIETITVQTKTSFDPLIHLAGYSAPFTLYGNATQVVSNQ